jgi:hypothetical protein
MQKLIFKITLLGGILFASVLTVTGQDADSSRARKAVAGTAKVGVVVIGTAAKYSWKATKFTGKHVAKPVIIKGAPAVGKFALKQSGNIVKRTVPVVRKFAVTYLKFRLSP